MTNGTEKYIGTVAYLGKLYDYCNAKLFNGELTKPVITVQRDERNKTNGWWSVKKVWKENNEDEGEHELNMTAQQLIRPLYSTEQDSICSMLIHEMCHQYAQANNMQDTSRAGNYHNKLFKKIAETHGLTVECVATIGWSHTTLTDETAALIAEFVKDNPDNVIYRLPVLKGQCVKTSSTRKYKCPCCGQSVRATKAVNIMCADCNEYMTEE
ncbi:MAG: SprT-like domain-containing protein [Roseburia sp.]|nr:SprT-like domain-containing protein [Roseburia sp.]